MKPLLTGLLNRNGPPSPDTARYVDNYVIHVLWKDLQPSAGGALDTKALDRALDEARDRGARTKLRVLAGVEAPGWAKRLTGSPVRMKDPTTGRAATIPRFWRGKFGAAYEELHEKLAARYDNDPALAEVVISRCTLFFAEPFVRQTALKVNRSALLKAGYTRAKDKDCHREQIDAHKVWARTRSGLAFNPAQFVTASGGRDVGDKFTVNMMERCRAELGSRCILENMSIRSPIASLDGNSQVKHYRKMYRAMKAQPTPVAFQTAAPARLGNCEGTLDWAVDMGASYVELPGSGAVGCSSSTLASAARRLN